VVFLLSPNARLTEGSRAVLTAPQAAALGGALGLVFALVSRLFKRK
jgi:hypothetical protein